VETFVFTSDPAPPDAAATRSSALWRALLEATADAVLVVGARGPVLVTNPAFNRLFGLQGQAAIPEGLSFRELCERLGESFADTPQFSRARRGASWPGGRGRRRMVDDDRRPDPRS
jgi:PAS domain-containing protein